MIKLGQFGPVPKRSSERIRRNKEENPVETLQAVGSVEPPALNFDNPHPMIVDFYNSLKESAQSRYYEPSDWQYARFICHYMDGQMKAGGKLSAQMLASISSALNDLLISEGARRRVRLEIERENAVSGAPDLADLFRQRQANLQAV